MLLDNKSARLEAGPLPLYLQLERQLRARVLNGEFSPGDALPTEERICSEYGVSRITVRRALDALIAQGLIVKRRGVGSFVTEQKKGVRSIRLSGSLDEFLATAGDLRNEFVSCEDVVPPAEISEVLALQSGERATRMEVTSFLDQEPVAFVQVYFPLAVGHLLDIEDVTNGLPIIRVVERKMNTRVARAEQQIEADTAGDAAAEHLGLAPTTPVLRVKRVYYSAFEQPIEAAVLRYHPERYKYAIDYRSST